MADSQLNIVIDGDAASARAGETLLSVCRRLGKDIPTLCHHEALAPYAACRVCLVEITAGGRSSLVPSCQYPVSDGLVVQTDSEPVRQTRRLVLELLLARCPGSEQVRSVAARYGVTETPYSGGENDQTCILCGLCVRVCEEVLGISAIGFSDRGVERQVGAPFGEESEACIGCGACIAVCPTGHISSLDDGAIRKMVTWNTPLELRACESCGRPFAPTRQLCHLRAVLPEHVPLENVCPACRRSQAAARQSETIRGQKAARAGGTPATGGPDAAGAVKNRKTQENSSCREK